MMVICVVMSVMHVTITAIDNNQVYGVKRQ